MFEQPVDAARHPASTTQIAVAEISRNLTGPSDLHQDLPDFVAGDVVLGAIRPWPIRDEEEPLRPLLGNGIKDPAGQFRPIEREDRDGNVEGGGLNRSFS